MEGAQWEVELKSSKPRLPEERAFVSDSSIRHPKTYILRQVVVTKVGSE